ncbi:hypothetical protein, partial [Candidatus Similichlamydia epinepheli]|uniref:hypothetical protein n=1 Tax=Candidatus Similichlamydia epinepheli TaxID=1903953 RepID=UPI001864D5B6
MSKLILQVKVLALVLFPIYQLESSDSVFLESFVDFIKNVYFDEDLKDNKVCSSVHCNEHSEIPKDADDFFVDPEVRLGPGLYTERESKVNSYKSYNFEDRIVSNFRESEDISICSDTDIASHFEKVTSAEGGVFVTGFANNETELLGWCKDAALSDKALFVIVDNPKCYFDNLTLAGQEHLQNATYVVKSNASVLSKTCRFYETHKTIGALIRSTFDDVKNGIFIEWITIHQDQRLFIDLMNSKVRVNDFFHVF